MPLPRAALAPALACLLFLATANAQLFLGTVGSALVSGGFAAPLAGVQAGTYDFGGFGVRGVLEFVPFATEGSTTFQAEATGLYVTGGGVKLYAGPSLGVLGGGSAAVPFGGLALGVDFDAESVISICLEVQPRYYFGGAAGVLIRFGTNFHFGL